MRKDKNRDHSLVERIVERVRGTGVGTEDPNIVGDVGPTDVPPGRDPEPEFLPGVVEEPDTGAHGELRHLP
jgi:hypothetical protein